MMQGDSYNLGFTVLNNAKVPVTPNDIKDMEVTVGHITKSYRNSQVIFSAGRWLFPLTQEETFGYWPKSVNCQVRIVWADGVVEGKKVHGVRVEESLSKEVL